MSLFFWLFTFAINLWHGKFVTADVTAVFVNNKHVNLLMRAFVSRDQSTLVHAYCTYVRPILEYNSVIWSPSNHS